MNAVLTGRNGVRVFFVSSYCVYFGIDVLVVFSCVLICKISFLTDTNILMRFVMPFSHI